MVSDPKFHGVLQYNLKENSRLKAEPVPAGRCIKDGVREAIVWFANQEVPALPAGTLDPPMEAFRKTQAAFAVRDSSSHALGDLLNRIPTDQLLACQQLNAPDGVLLSAELAGVQDDYVFTYDGVNAGLESLAIQKPHVWGPGFSWVPTVPLASQPIGWKREKPQDPAFRLAHLDLDLVATKKSHARLVATETIQAIRPGLRVLSMAMMDHRFIPGEGGVAKRAEVAVKRVSVDGGGDLPFVHGGGNLLVELPAPLDNGGTVKLRFEIEGALQREWANFALWQLTPGTAWIPQPCEAGQGYTVKARIAVEKPFVAIASANTVRRSSDETHNILEASQEKPILGFSVAAGRYECTELVRNGKTVRVWSYSSAPKGVEPVISTAHACLDFCELAYLAVPFPEVNLVETPSIWAFQAVDSQSAAGMIWLSHEAFDPASRPTRAVQLRYKIGGEVTRTLAHELARQYWAPQVRMLGFEEDWITESFAEYTAALAMRVTKGKGPGVFDAIVQAWKDDCQPALSLATIPTANYLTPADNTSDTLARSYRKRLLYDKGPYLLACIHREIGEQKFITFLRAYQKNFSWNPPRRILEIPELLRAVTGKDWTAWFDRYFWGTELPPMPK